MIKSFIIPALAIFGASLLLSNSGGVPQAVTKAPGESGKNCNACHDGGNYNTSVELLVKDSMNNPVFTYNPNYLYQLEVKVSGENNPKSYGFQLVSLADSDNKDVGIWSELGQRVKIINLLQRKYLVQSSAKQDGMFTMKWKAPASDIGTVSFYFSGMAVNLNGDITGDSPVSNKVTLSSPMISSDFETFTPLYTLYPNPVEETLNILSEETIVSIKVFNISGLAILQTQNPLHPSIDVQGLYPGTYILEVETTHTGKKKRSLFQKL